MAPKETENNAFWGDKQRALWYVMVFSGVVNSLFSQRPQCTLFIPQNFANPLSSIFSWNECNIQEKLETMVKQNFGK